MTTRTLSSVDTGDALPPLDIETSAALVVGGALASRDYTPVHHDTPAARATGAQDIFMNILTTNGLVGRYVTDWAGPDSTVTEVRIKLGSPNYPGDTMKMVGSVKAKDDDTRTVRVELVGKNGWGQHVEGNVAFTLP